MVANIGLVKLSVGYENEANLGRLLYQKYRA